MLLMLFSRKLHSKPATPLSKYTYEYVLSKSLATASGGTAYTLSTDVVPVICILLASTMMHMQLDLAVGLGRPLPVQTVWSQMIHAGHAAITLWKAANTQPAQMSAR